MSIFRRDSEPQPPVSPAASPPAAKRPNPELRSDRATLVAPGSKITGHVSGTAELVIEGEVDGEINLDSRVVVGSGGFVHGQVQGRSVQVGGKVVGNVRGIERVEVLASGSLEGDVTAPRVVIAEGAFFKGKVEMTDKATDKLAAKTVAKTEGNSEKSPVKNVAETAGEPLERAGGKGGR